MTALDLLSGTPWYDPHTYTITVHTGEEALKQAVAAQTDQPSAVLSVVCLTGMAAGAGRRLEGVLSGAGVGAVAGETEVIDKIKYVYTHTHTYSRTYT